MADEGSVESTQLVDYSAKKSDANKSRRGISKVLVRIPVFESPSAEDRNSSSHKAAAPTLESEFRPVLADEDNAKYHDNAKSQTPASRTVSPSVEKDATSLTNTLTATPKAIQLMQGQTRCLPFPIGCQVWSKQAGANATMKRGTVVGVHLNLTSSNELLYKYKVSFKDSTEMMEGSELGYASGTRIFYSSTGSFATEDILPGEVICCKNEKSTDFYTIEIMIFINGGLDTHLFQVVEDVPPSRIKLDVELLNA